MNNLDALIKWYEELRPTDLNKLSNFYCETAFFKDPFNEVNGLNKITKIFEHMFSTLESPSFKFIDTIEDTNSAFLTWDFHFLIKGKKFKIHGSSHLKFDNDHKIIYHRDYWDVGEELLLKIPIVQWLYGILYKKMKIN